MAKEIRNGCKPPACRIRGITPNTSCAGSADASSTAMDYTRVPDGTWHYQCNAPYYPADGTTTAYGHADKAGNTGHRLLMSSNGRGDVKALGNDARISTRARKREPQEFDGVCGKAYSTRHALRRHATEPRDHKAYIRKARDQRSVQKPKFVRHYRKRAGEQLYKCETCGKSFKQLGNLKVHHRRHTGEKPYACKTCGKAFAQMGHLNVHRRKHTGERPYYCNTCGKSFRQMANLDVHKRTHTGEKRRVSAKRAKSFKCKQSPNDHSNLHEETKPFICETCNQLFLYKSSLRRHRRSHADETPRKFAQCDISLRDKGTLHKHVCPKVICCLCGEYFTDTDQLAAHLVAHAGGRP